MFKCLKRNKIYEDDWLTFYRDDVEFPDGSIGTYAWLSRKNGVGIVVATTDDKILLNKEYRYVIENYSWEIPGGGIDKGETPEKAAIRELYEETGIKADKLESLGIFYPLNSVNTESITAFYTIIEPTDLTLSKTESGEQFVEQKYFNFSEVLEMIDKGELQDGPSANVIQMVIRRLKK